MTRETKIGLLVGLAFIIVIGVLLSDHFASTIQPPPAPLSVTAENLLIATATPGGQRADTAEVRVGTVQPNRVVDIPVPLDRNGVADVRVGPGQQSGNAGTNTGDGAASGTPPAGQRFGSGDAGGNDAASEGNGGGNAGIAVREYVAEPGDTLSRMAGKLLGRNTAANREAIMRLNPSLQKEPHRVFAGQKYQIPVSASEPASPVRTTSTETASGPTPPATGETTYVTKPGDTLWRIAVEQLGSGAAVDQIKELNRDVLRNGDRILPNMKLRIPPKAVASAD